jgi:carbamate kinase
MRRSALVAIGGNSLIRPGESTTVATQRVHVAEICRALADIVARGWRVVVTHGNGPQVGAALRRSELGAIDTYPLPLDMCVASTQGEIGVLLQQALAEAFESRAVRRPIVTILTQVAVSPDDPAFAAPSKPIGPFYPLAEAETRRRAGWTLIEEPPHGYRRAVASPQPVEIVEEPAIGALVDADVVVIAAGGGGVPVVRRDGRIEGIEAVIDKDLASALLATHLRVDLLAMSTDVDRIYLNFARPDACGLGHVTADELRRFAADGQFPAGTMGPKVEAALQFLAAGGSEVIVTSPDRLVAAIDGHDEGTRVVNAARAARRRRGRALASTVVG